MIDPDHQFDPLLECLVIFAKLHNRPISVEALIAGLPVKPGDSGPELFSIDSPKGLFSRVAARAGFASRLIHRDLANLSRLLLPCILVLKNGNACILESIDRKNKRAKVIFPEVGEGEEWLDLDTLGREYLGYAFLLKRELQQNQQAQKALSKDDSHWFWGTLAKSRDMFASVLLSSILIMPAHRCVRFSGSRKRTGSQWGSSSLRRFTTSYRTMQTRPIGRRGIWPSFSR